MSVSQLERQKVKHGARPFTESRLILPLDRNDKKQLGERLSLSKSAVPHRPQEGSYSQNKLYRYVPAADFLAVLV